MPQIQVIGRDPTEIQNDRANQAIERQKILQDTWYKAQMMKYYADELKTKLQMSQDEVIKAKLSQQFEYTKLGAGVMENAYKIAEKHGGKAAQDYLMGVQQQSPELFPNIMQSGFANRLANLNMSGEQRLANTAANVLQRQIGGQPNQDQPVTGVTQGVTNDSRVDAVAGQFPTTPVDEGGPVVPDMTVQGIHIVNPSVQNDLARRDVFARKTAERDVEMEPIRKSVNNYLNTFDAAVGEMGGLGENALMALMKGKGAEALANVGNKPNIFALNKLIEPVSLQLGSYLNKGRPTDKDQAAAKDTLTRVTYTKGVNAILRHYLETIIATGDKDLATKLFWTLAKEGGSRSADARNYSDSNMLKAIPSTRFTIKLKE